MSAEFAPPVPPDDATLSEVANASAAWCIGWGDQPDTEPAPRRPTERPEPAP